MSNTTKNIFLPLQRRQMAHDERAHWDIYCLPQLDKLKHMALHFFKYVGRLATAKEDAQVSRTLVDALIICLSAANAINLSLEGTIAACSPTETLNDLAMSLENHVHGSNLGIFAALEIGRVGGHIAKALESMDHIERGDQRSALEAAIPQLVEVVLACLGVLEVDIVLAIEKRYEEVEAALILRMG